MRHSSRETRGTYSYALGFSYRLKSGRMVYRSYEVIPEEAKKLILALYEEENLKDFQYGFQKVEPEYIDDVYLSTSQGDGYSVFPNEKEKLEELLAALNKDIENMTAEDMLEVPVASLNLSYSLPVEENASNLAPGQKEPVSQASWVVNVMPGFQETLAILEKTGYPLSIDEINIRSVTVTYYGDEKETSVEYTKPEEIEALKAAIYPSYFYAPWLERSAGVSATYISDRGNNNFVDLLADKLPDFVKEKMAEVGSDHVSGTVGESDIVEEYIDDDDSAEVGGGDASGSEDTDQAETAIIGGADGPTSVYIKSDKAEE